jgi:hypothetical protein
MHGIESSLQTKEWAAGEFAILRGSASEHRMPEGALRADSGTIAVATA